MLSYEQRQLIRRVRDASIRTKITVERPKVDRIAAGHLPYDCDDAPHCCWARYQAGCRGANCMEAMREQKRTYRAKIRAEALR
jgi:hypothetical protein